MGAFALAVAIVFAPSLGRAAPSPELEPSSLLRGEAEDECGTENLNRVALGGLIGMGGGGIAASAIDALWLARRYGGPARNYWVVVPSFDARRCALHFTATF